MRVVASLLLVAFWVAIAFAALLVSTEPDSGPVAGREAEDIVRESAEVAAAADEAEGDAEEEAEEVFTQAELESPEFESEEQETAAAPTRKSALGEVATALRSPVASDDRAPVEAVLQDESSARTLDDLLSDKDTGLAPPSRRLDAEDILVEAGVLVAQ